MYRLIDAATTGAPFPLYGDGTQIRDFTYVDDVVQANVLAATSDVPPTTVLNIGGGAMTSLSSVIATVERLVGASVPSSTRARLPAMPARPVPTPPRHASCSVGSPRSPSSRAWSNKSHGSALDGGNHRRRDRRGRTFGLLALPPWRVVRALADLPEPVRRVARDRVSRR